MTSIEGFLQVVDAFTKLDLPYVTVGSFAANVYMDPRSTKDADFVLQLEKLNLNTLLEALGQGWTLDPQISMESVTLTTRYKLNREDSAFSVELFGLSSDPHDQSRFNRRASKSAAGRSVWVLTAEDVLVTKLRWLASAKRTKDQADIENVLKGQAGRLDYPYIRAWCDQHGTRELFEQLYEEARKYE